MQDAQNELGSFLPSEALLGGTAAEDGALADFLRDRFHTCVNIGTDAQFDPALCAAAVTAQFGQSPEALGLANMPCVIAAAGALLITLRFSLRCAIYRKTSCRTSGNWNCTLQASSCSSILPRGGISN